jgi:hypothetical protein
MRASACLSLNNIISVKEGTNVIIVIWQERREEFSLIHISRHDCSALYGIPSISFLSSLCVFMFEKRKNNRVKKCILG